MLSGCLVINLLSLDPPQSKMLSLGVGCGIHQTSQRPLIDCETFVPVADTATLANKSLPFPRGASPYTSDPVLNYTLVLLRIDTATDASLSLILLLTSSSSLTLTPSPTSPLDTIEAILGM